MKTLRVLIVDDLAQVREGLAALLDLAGHKLDPAIQVAGAARDGVEAIRLSQALHPDGLLVVLEMPGMDGYAATRQIKASQAQVRVIVLSIHAGAEAVQKARQAGADGFVVKGMDTQTLLNAIRAGD